MEANLQFCIKSISANIAITLLGAAALFAEQGKQRSLASNEAVVYLKNSGEYESLDEAIQLARYGIRAVEDLSLIHI